MNCDCDCTACSTSKALDDPAWSGNTCGRHKCCITLIKLIQQSLIGWNISSCSDVRPIITINNNINSIVPTRIQVHKSTGVRKQRMATPRSAHGTAASILPATQPHTHAPAPARGSLKSHTSREPRRRGHPRYKLRLYMVCFPSSVQMRTKRDTFSSRKACPSPSSCWRPEARSACNA